MRIGLIGKYVSLQDAYLSVVEALKHGGFFHGAKVEIEWIQAEDVEGLLAEGRIGNLDGVVIPGGFGERGTEGKIAAARYAREQQVPCLGLCLGLQMMTIDFARNVLGLERANSTRDGPADAAPGHRPHGRPARRPQHGRHPAPRRLHRRARPRARRSPRPTAPPWCPSATGTATSSTAGTAASSRTPGSSAAGCRPTAGWSSSSSCPRHPFWVGTQAHPEFKSRPNKPAPLFREFVAAALARAEGRNPHLLDITDRAHAPRRRA